jgi:hypothetical protein
VLWQLSSSRGALKLLFLTQGPAHCKSTSWFDDILVEQVVRVFREGFQTQWQHPTTELGGEPNRITSRPVLTIVFATAFRVEEGQTYRQHAVIAAGCMDRPAADMCGGRAGHAAKLACGFGPPCVGETCAHLRDGDDTEEPSVLPKKGHHVPGKSTVTWQRLLQQENILETVLNEPNSDAIIQVTTTTPSLRLI